MQHVINFGTDGTARTVYTEALPLGDLGQLTATRASNVDFNEASQEWEVIFTDEPMAIAFSHPSRAECIRWEVAELNRKLLEQ